MNVNDVSLASLTYGRIGVASKDTGFLTKIPTSFTYESSKDVLRMRHANLFEEEPLLDELMQLVGFSNLSSLRCFNIDSLLITTLVERSRPDTFHLPCGECTITLGDVSLQLGVNVNSRPITRPTYFDWDEMCGELLGKVPIVEEDMRARILYIIGGELLPDKSNSRVYLIWGSACLANLYRELCRATKPNAKAMGGCLMLLQSWAWYRLPFLAPKLDGLPTYPFAKRWGQTQLIFQGVPRGDLTGYRSCLDHMEVSDFKWLLYQTYINNLLCQVQQDKRVWNRVRLQFGLVQDIPQGPKNLDVIHRVDKRGNQDANWATKHAQWIEYWSQRRDQVLRGLQIQYPIHTQEYNIWNRINSKLFLSSETQL
ncbi:hypothetical protein Lal_00040378 [Lupinus albus]|nr:hypothetical protein Lal_00040378 [Lupinus albus]